MAARGLKVVEIAEEEEEEDLQLRELMALPKAAARAAMAFLTLLLLAHILPAGGAEEHLMAVLAARAGRAVAGVVEMVQVKAEFLPPLAFLTPVVVAAVVVRMVVQFTSAPLAVPVS